MTLINESRGPQSAAKIAGAAYLLTMIASVFNEFFARGSIAGHSDMATLAAQLAANEQLFRIGLASELFNALGVTVLAVALYVIVKPVNRHVALLALLWRVVEVAVLAIIPLTSFVVMKLLSGTGYLNVFESEQLGALAKLFLDSHAYGADIGLLFFSIGSATFSYLFLKSRLIPKLLAGWGVFASLLVFVCTAAYFLAPDQTRFLFPACYLPIFIYEVTLGFWLLVKGIRTETV